MFRTDAASFVIAFVTAVALGRLAQAEVVESTHAGFHLQITANIAASPEEVYDCLVDDIGKWWESDHTFSGDAQNLYLEDQAKGWFGERACQLGHPIVRGQEPGNVLLPGHGRRWLCCSRTSGAAG